MPLTILGATHIMSNQSINLLGVVVEWISCAMEFCRHEIDQRHLYISSLDTNYRIALLLLLNTLLLDMHPIQEERGGGYQ